MLPWRRTCPLRRSDLFHPVRLLLLLFRSFPWDLSGLHRRRLRFPFRLLGLSDRMFLSSRSFRSDRFPRQLPLLRLCRSDLQCLLHPLHP
jgi:hypothetical protein